MRQKSNTKVYQLTLIYRNNLTRNVRVKASSREVAEQRALKRNKTAIGVRPYNG